MKKKRKTKSAIGLRLRNDLAELQRDFGELDLFTRPRAGNSPCMELLLITLERIGIRMEPDVNHKRAHVHISYGKLWRAASYAVDTGERLAGELEHKYDRVVRDWIAGRRQKLLELWVELKPVRTRRRCYWNCARKGNSRAPHCE